jgi:hypothetical protein
MFFLTGFGILRLIRRLEEKAEPNLRVSLKLGAIYDPKNFEKYIASKPIKQQKVTTRVGTSIHEYTWDDDSEKWLGNEGSIVFYVDTTNQILLSATVNIDAPKNITTKEASQILVKELIDASVVPKNVIEFIR